MAGLRRLQTDLRVHRGRARQGPDGGVELVKDPETKDAGGRLARGEIIQRAFEKGLLLLGCGENSIRFCPSLTVSADEIDLCLTLFEETVREVAG